VRKVQIENRDKRGLVTLQIKLSNADVSFDDLPDTLGCIQLNPGETVELEVGEFKEILYRKSLPNTEKLIFSLFRIAIDQNEEITKGFIWPY
jgi:hypothetical protein